MKKHGGKRLILAEYVRARMHDEERVEGRGYQARVARLTNFSTAHITNILGERRAGIGIDFIEAIADRVWHVPVAKLEEESKAWAAEHPELAAPVIGAPRRWTDLIQRYPNYVDAVKLNVARAFFTEDEAQASLECAAHMPNDLEVETWLGVLRDWKRARDFERRAPAEAKRLEDKMKRPPTDDDEPPIGEMLKPKKPPTKGKR